MLKISSRLAGLLTVGIMLAPPPARADPIPITAGSMVLPQNQEATVHLEGPRGFTLNAFNPFTMPATQANTDCSGSSELLCLPGERISLNAGSSGSDLNGVATLDGQTFEIGLGTDVQGSAVIQFNSSFVVLISRPIWSPFSHRSRSSVTCFPRSVNFPPARSCS